MKLAVIVAAVITSASQADAQALYLGVRGGAGIPTGDFAADATGTGDAALLRGASPGFGYGLDAGIGSPLLGLYAGYDHIQFECRSSQCVASGKYELTGYSAGLRVSVPLLPLFRPWAKAGVTYNEMKGRVNGSPVTTGKHPGYEVGAGADIPILLGFFSLTPQVRLVKQKLEPVITSSSAPSGGKRSAGYYTFDLGFRIRTPL